MPCGRIFPRYYIERGYKNGAAKVFPEYTENDRVSQTILALRYPRPPKYDQVVRSGILLRAMENTNGFHFLWKNWDSRAEAIDEELGSTLLPHAVCFTKWFGDYVTADLGLNLPLNELFANYTWFFNETNTNMEPNRRRIKLMHETRKLTAEAESKLRI